MHSQDKSIKGKAYVHSFIKLYDLWKVLLVVFVNAGQIHGAEGIFMEQETNQGSDTT